MLKSNYMSKETIDMFLKVFGSLKQKVIWKFEADLPNKPANLKLVKWLPQMDVLGHKNTKMFITHAGQSSVQETLCYGVPTVKTARRNHKRFLILFVGKNPTWPLQVACMRIKVLTTCITSICTHIRMVFRARSR